LLIGKPTLEHLKGTLAFVTAARQGSFTLAARTLDLSPQAVAASIGRLEIALGARLFNRTTRSIALTEEGQAFLSRAQIGLAALEEAALAVRDKHGSPEGKLRVTCGAAFGRRYLLDLLPGFHKQYPKVRIDLSMDDRKVDLVQDGFDIAIRGGAIADSSLITRKICALHSVMVASPAYLNKHGIPSAPQDLQSHQIIWLRFASGLNSRWDLKMKSKQISFETESPHLTLSDTESIAQAAVLGLGIARVSLHFAWHHLVAGRLRVVLNSFNDPGTREMVIHYPHREHVAPRSKAFVDYMLKQLQKNTSLMAGPKDLAPFFA
jgi:DNA-binding transcriptional LysR family regulator